MRKFLVTGRTGFIGSNLRMTYAQGFFRDFWHLNDFTGVPKRCPKSVRFAFAPLCVLIYGKH